MEQIESIRRNQLSLPRVAGSFFYGGAGVDAYQNSVRRVEKQIYKVSKKLILFDKSV